MNHFDNLLDHYANSPIYTYEEALEASVEYFDGDLLAGQKFLDKYALRNEKNELVEKTPTDMHWRIANEFARIEKNKFKNPLTAQEIFDLLDHFKYIVPQGSPMYGIGNPFQYISLSNCFVIDSPVDSYAGILKTDEELVQISKRRGGVGLDLSLLRPENSPTKNAAKTSTGVVSFAERYSNSIREVGQNGRRGALMLTLSVLHPSVMAFIKAKSQLNKVTGANISVRLYDEFLQAVENNITYRQRFPVDSNNPTIQYDVDANTIWNEIIYNAWKYAEPGLQFWDNIIRESVSDCYAKFGFKTICSNPSLRGNTRVLTSKGCLTIKELSEIDHSNIKVKNLLGEWKTFKAFKTGENKKLWKITFTNGQTVFCTPEHKWPILNTSNHIINPQTNKVKKKETNKLIRGEKIYFPIQKEPIDNDDCTLNNEDGFILGWSYGDGWKSYHKCNKSYQYGFIFSSSEMDIGERVLKYTNNLAKRSSTLRQDHDCNAYTFSTTDSIVCTRMDELGYSSKETGIPESVWRGNKEFIHGFIDGLFSSDGHIRETEYFATCYVNLTTKYENLANDIRKLLSFYGISSTITKTTQKVNFPNGKDYNKEYTIFNLRASGINAIKFASIFTLSSTQKQLKLNNIKNKEIRYGQKNYKNLHEYLVIKTVEESDIVEDVYDISVDDNTHTFFMETGLTGNCSEIFMNANDSCRLLLQNLFSYLINPFTKNAKFDYDLFYQHAQVAQRLMDDMIDLEIEMVDRIINKIQNDPEIDEIKNRELNLWIKIKNVAQTGRRTGSGITALADVIAGLGIGYATDTCITVVDNIYKTLKLGCYRSSVNMAKEIGPFPIWDHELEKNNPFLLRIKDQDISLWEDMKKYGRRNIALLTTAPTGTVSIMTQTSGGIEPEFSIVPYTRRVKGNPGDKNFRSDFIDQNGDHWMEFEVVKPKLKLWMEITGETDYTKSPWYGYCANDINWVKRVELQGVAQRHVDHSISSCLAIGESDILTSAGMLDIGEFTVGNVKDFKKLEKTIYSKNINDEEAEITETYNNGLADTILIELEKGRRIRCTPNHKLVILNDKYELEWKEAALIKEGEFVVGRKGLNLWNESTQNLSTIIGKPFEYSKLTNSKNVRKIQRMSRDLARLIGYLCSDGSIGPNGINLCQLENNVGPDFANIVNSLFDVEVTKTSDPRSQNLYNWVVNSREIANFFRYLGLTNHDDMTVPKVIRCSGRECVKEFIKGLTLDGYVSNNGIGVMTSVSYKFLSQVQNLLLNLGIESSLLTSSEEGVREFPSGKTYPTKESYVLFISHSDDIERFVDFIGFAEDRKNDESKSKIKRPSRTKVKGTIPDFGLRKQFRDRYLPQIKSNRLYDLYNSLTNNDKQGRLLNKESLQEMVDFGLEVPNILLDNTYTFSIVKSKSFGGQVQTLDLSVPNKNSYIANGLISHNTINLPNNATVEDVKNIYMAAWKHGLKGITVYRDGCRTGVLVHKQTENKNEIVDSTPPKRPKKIDAEVYHTTYKGQPYFIMVGMLNDKPYEVFAGKNGFIDKSVTKCVIEKVKRGHYKTILENDKVIENISEYISDEEAAITRLISLSLRHGANIKYCVATLQKVPGDMHNFAKVLSRILKKYIPDNETITGFGEGEGTYVFQEGCVKRLEDGWTLCM